MNDPENNLADSADWKNECLDLRRQVGMLFVALIIISLAFAAFLGLQVRRTSQDLQALRGQQKQILDAERKEEPTIKTFLSKVTEYSRTHPDLAPILAKYGVQQTSGVPGTATPPRK